MNLKESFTAASIFPVKLVVNKNAIDLFERIKPIHIQLCPTNICNLKCRFCSCSERDKTLELSYEKIERILNMYASLGCEAITITGGGEPLLHPEINSIISLLKKLNISIGLVTNGIELNRLSKNSLNSIKWIRISGSDHREFNQEHQLKLYNIIDNTFVDWSFSYVLSSDINLENIINTIQFANVHFFTHVRLVSNLLDVDNAPDMNSLKSTIRCSGIDDGLVIYQGRKEYTKGHRECLISLLKPVIGADGKIYPCCGAQYAESKTPLDYSESMCMGDYSEMSLIFSQQKHFDGSNCIKCYYGEYNKYLSLFKLELLHREFV